MTLDWMRTPIRVPFARGVRRVVTGRMPNAAGAPISRWLPMYRTGDTARGQDEQRRRVQDLFSAMGLKTKPSDRQIAKVIELLGPFVPGLTIESPTSVEPVPSTFSVPYVAPPSGRPRLNDDDCRQFAAEVQRRLDSSPGRLSRKRLYTLMAKDAKARGGEPSTASKAEYWDARGRNLLGRK